MLNQLFQNKYKLEYLRVKNCKDLIPTKGNTGAQYSPEAWPEENVLVLLINN
jgi:hypothetical protein